MVKMLELWLIRHGETTWNAEKRIQGHSIQGHMDSPLSELGLRQAKALRARLSTKWNAVIDNVSITRFYISPQQKILMAFNDAAHTEGLGQDYDD
jgi:broad specificity phosphatase PhoE